MRKNWKIEKLKLKNCPFCGGRAKIEKSHPSEINHNYGAVHFKVTCPVMVDGYPSQCTGSHSNLWHISPEDAAEAWNVRAGGWISVDERLPQVGDYVLVYDEIETHGSYYTVRIDKYILACISGEEFSESWRGVSHWQPLPEPPHGLT